MVESTPPEEGPFSQGEYLRRRNRAFALQGVGAPLMVFPLLADLLDLGQGVHVRNEELSAALLGLTIGGIALFVWGEILYARARRRRPT